jgi:hypothetical protein
MDVQVGVLATKRGKHTLRKIGFHLTEEGGSAEICVKCPPFQVFY